MSTTGIVSRYNTNPYKQRNFIVKCHAHRIYTTVTATPSVARSWISRIRRYHALHLRSGRMVVGLGVQWTPSFEPGLKTPPATLQLCVGRNCLIFQLLRATRVPLSLRRFLYNPDITLVGVANRSDKGMLQCSKHKLSVLKLVDLCHVASEMRGHSKRISMEKLADLVLGMEGVKKAEGVGRSDWDGFRLSEAQVEYACVDAFVSFSLGKALKVWNWVDDDDD